jgi:hypothetical protein
MRSMTTMTDYDWKYIRVHQLGYDYQVKDIKFNPRDKVKGVRDQLLQILKGIAQCQYTACTNYVDSLIDSDDIAEFGEFADFGNSPLRQADSNEEDNNSTDRKMIILTEDNKSTDRKMIIPTDENFRDDRHKWEEVLHNELRDKNYSKQGNPPKISPGKNPPKGPAGKSLLEDLKQVNSELQELFY